MTTLYAIKNVLSGKAYVGSTVGPEQRAKKMQAMRGKREVVTCPHCGVQGGGGNMRRYHFDGCKQK